MTSGMMESTTVARGTLASDHKHGRRSARHVQEMIQKGRRKMEALLAEVDQNLLQLEEPKARLERRL